jgi:hypothetical protein
MQTTDINQFRDRINDGYIGPFPGSVIGICGIEYRWSPTMITESTHQSDVCVFITHQVEELIEVGFGLSHLQISSTSFLIHELDETHDVGSVAFEISRTGGRDQKND